MFLKDPLALYGSDALGGVISFNSLKAEDLLVKRNLSMKLLLTLMEVIMKYQMHLD